MEISNLIPHIEALIFASEKPLTTLEITDLINNAFGFMEDKISLDQIESAMEGILEKYRAEFYPFEVRESGGGWQFLTKKDFHKTVAQLNGDKFLKRLSTAALETLSIIAYKQPVTKAEIEAIRGVSSDYAIQKLLEKDLIVITGRNEKLPGHPLVYGTSKNFMDYFGLNSPEDLPKLKEVFDDSIGVPTMMGEETPAAETPAAEAESLTDPDMHEPSMNGSGLNGVDMSEEDAAEDTYEKETEEETLEETVEETALTDSEALTEEGNGEPSYNDIEDLDDEELSEEDFEGEEEEEDEDLEELEELEAEYDEGMEEEYEASEEESAHGDNLIEEDDNTIYKVGEDGELIKEHTSPGADDASGDDADNESKDTPDEEKE
jgi:segregation and condensation protein B